ncbi:MAG: hypothetical protein ACT4N2_00645 [Hyphomicrobium sp.]
MTSQSATAQDWQAAFARAQAAKTVNVVCMKWGTLYGPEWVNRLYAMVVRNTTWTVRFVCFTDDATGLRAEVEARPIPTIKLDAALGKRWPKLGLFSEHLADLTGMTLYLDLDLVILSSLDPFFELPGRFCIISEWQDRHLGYGNSSVMRYFAGGHPEVLARFYSKPHQHWFDLYASKEQNFVSKTVTGITYWPEDWCAPFSYACLPRNRIRRFFATPTKPEGAKILVFFGSVTPATAIEGRHKAEKRSRKRFLNLRNPIRRRFGPARWIADYWRE